MRKAYLVYPLVICLILASCSPSPGSPTPSPELQLTSTQPATTPSPTPPLPTDTATATSTPQPTSTITPTPTPVSRVISLDNASHLVEVGRIGKGVIHQIAWSPSGETLALGTSVGIYTYSIDPLAELSFIDAPQGVNALTFGADDDTLIAAFNTPDNSLRIFNPTSGELLHQFGFQCVNFLSYSSATNVLASGDADDHVRLWNAETGEYIRMLDTVMWLSSLIISPDGSQVFIGGETGYYDPSVLEIWDAITGTLLSTINGPVSGDPEHLAISPDNSLLAAAGFNVVVRSLPAGDYLYLGDTDDTVMDLTFSSDNHWLIMGTYEGAIQVWNSSTGALERILPAHNRNIISIASQPNGSLVASAGEDGLVQLWDTADWEVVGSIDGFHQYGSLQLSPDGTKVAATDWGKIYLWDMTTYSLIHVFEFPTGSVYSLAFSPDNRLLAAGGCGDTYESRCPYGAIYLWDLESQELVHTIYGHEEEINDLVFSPDGEILASISWGDNKIKFWEVSTGVLMLDLEEGWNPSSIVMSPTGDRFAALIYEAIHIRYFPSGDTVQTINMGDWWLEKCAVFSLDGRLLMAGVTGGEILGLDSTTGSRMFRLEYPFVIQQSGFGNPPSVLDLQYLPQGKGLVASYSTAQVAFWNIEERHMVYAFNPSYSNTTVELTPDGLSLLTNSWQDGIIRIWAIQP